MTNSLVYRFSKNHCDWAGSAADAKKILGGKGAGLVKMSQHEMPVPPGFTIPTTACNEYHANTVTGAALASSYLAKIMAEVEKADEWLHAHFSYRPLVSVRSGAPISMPGMMDTILNVGLTSETLPDWIERLGERAALDSYRRLIQMLGATAYGVPMEKFEKQLDWIKAKADVKNDADLDAVALSMLVATYLEVFAMHVGHAFPQSREEQLKAAIRAVFNSWHNERAVAYRDLNKIPHDMGTAVTVQAMVFGNTGNNSGSGVLFTRNPLTGEAKIMGEYLANAQGEDVVAGIRTPLNLDEIDAPWRGELDILCFQLEEMYADMVDCEFTVQDDCLFLLQSRVGKRSARAAFRIAVDLVNEGMIDRGTARQRLTVEQFKVLRRPSIDPSFKTKPTHVGLPACPGIVSGVPVYSAEDAVNCKEPCILVSHETTPEDIKGMNAAIGILTQTGGATSHAAVVARAMDKTCVTGCTDLKIEAMKGVVKRVTINGDTGDIWFDVEVPVIDSSDAPELNTVIDWCLEVMGVCEATVTDIGMDKPHTIQAAQWWGNEDVLQAVLDGIAELPQRQHITLDLTPPSAFVSSADAELTDCFGVIYDDKKFAYRASQILVERASELKGLALRNFYGNIKLADLGYTVAGFGLQSVPTAVPADFAAYTVLARA